MKLKLECVLCESLFTEEDILNYLFFSTTRICFKCYKKLYKAEKDTSCFGKSYNALATECRELCPDRKICPKFFTRKIFKLRNKAENNLGLIHIKSETIVTRKYPFRSGSIIDRAFKLCINGIAKLKLRNWCNRHSTSYYRIIKVLKRENKYGKQWKFNETSKRFELEYHIK